MNKFTLSLLITLVLSFAAFAQTEVETLIEKAQKLNLQSKSAEAIAEINKAIALEPTNANLYNIRADFHFINDNKPEALKDVLKAVSLAPNDKRVLSFGISTLSRAAYFKEALQISDQLIALGETHRFDWSARIEIKMQLKDFVGAFEDVSTALDLFPEENMFIQKQALLLRMLNDSEKALQIYNRVIASAEKKIGKQKSIGETERFNADLASFLFSRANLYLSEANIEKAQADLIKAIEYAPTDFNYLRRAKVYRELKMYGEAEADLTKALAVLKQSDKIQILVERGDVFVFEKKYDEALKDYEEILRLDSTLKELLDQRIVWLKQMRNKYPVQPN